MKKQSKKENIPEGLNQTFFGSDCKPIKLKDCLTESDWWILKKRNNQSTILTHEAIKKLADLAGISKKVSYNIKLSPTHENNYMLIVEVEVCDDKRCTTEWGEVNRQNLGGRGRLNPANMAQKRGYDRAVLRHLGISGLLGEDELSDEPEENMNQLSQDEQKEIVPIINKIINCKIKSDLTKINNLMKTESSKYKINQLEVLRGLFRKKVGELTKTF